MRPMQLWPPSILWRRPVIPPPGDLSGRVVLVTGGETDTGYEVCKILLANNARVYLAAPVPSRAHRAIKALKRQTGKTDIHYLQLDLASIASISQASTRFMRAEAHLHIFFAHATVPIPQFEEEILKTADGYELQFGANVLGHHALALSLLPVLARTARAMGREGVRVVATGAASGRVVVRRGELNIASLDAGTGRSGRELRDRSKLGTSLWVHAFARRFAEERIFAYTASPGRMPLAPLRGLLAPYINLRPSAGARQLVWVGTSEDVKRRDAGALFVPYTALCHDEPAGARDRLRGDRLWEWLEERRCAELGKRLTVLEDQLDALEIKTGSGSERGRVD